MLLSPFSESLFQIPSKRKFPIFHNIRGFPFNQVAIARITFWEDSFTDLLWLLIGTIQFEIMGYLREIAWISDAFATVHFVELTEIYIYWHSG